jgi:hypothetical protein
MGETPENRMWPTLRGVPSVQPRPPARETFSPRDVGAREFSGAMLGPALRDKHAFDFRQRMGPQLPRKSTTRVRSGLDLRIDSGR